MVKIRDKQIPQGRILNATISKEPSGKYYVSLCCTDVEIANLENANNNIGLDFGIKEFCIISNGETIENPKYLKKSLNKLSKLQRELSRKSKGSSNRNKARLKVARLQERISNQRKDFLQKLSTKLIRENDIICIENLQRSDLNPIEEALGYQELMGTYEMTQEQAAARVGKSRPAVANALRLLSLSPAVLELVKDGSLSAGHARALLPVKDEAQQLSIAQKVMALGLSVRQTEALCKKLTKQAQPVKEQPPQVDYLAECEKELTAGLGRKVRIVSGKRKGRIELEYYGQDDLQQLYDALHTIRKKEQH